LKQLIELIWCVAGTEQKDMYASEEYLASDILKVDQEEKLWRKTATTRRLAGMNLTK